MADEGIGYRMLTITTVFLLSIFFAAEFYRFRHRITGSIREIRPIDGDPTGLMGARLQVVTSEASEITAFVSGCQMCVCRVEIGETVSLVPGPNGYVMKSPWISRRRHGVCPKGVGS
jgi:hypothetical protein